MIAQALPGDGSQIVNNLSEITNSYGKECALCRSYLKHRVSHPLSVCGGGKFYQDWSAGAMRNCACLLVSCPNIA